MGARGLGVNIVVVGASSSVGRAVVPRFEAAGHRVHAAGSKDVNLLDPTAIADFAKSASPPVDVLIILAGICLGKPLVAYDDIDATRVMQVNFIGPAMLVRAMLPRMGAGAHVIMMSSIGARASYDPIYAASKSAVEGFVRAMAKWSEGIRVNAIAPGLIEDSAMWGAMAPERRAGHVQQTPTGRLTTLDQVAGIVFDMCGPAWANVNGHVIQVNGGLYV